MRVIVSFSGGKDSQASLIWAVNKYGKDRVEAVFCDTGWEHPITYEHIYSICNLSGVKLNTLKNEKMDGFEGLCKRMKCFPVSSRRACTSELKIKPMIDWILSQDDNLLIIQGIRGKESASRAKMAKECSYFSEYFDAQKTMYRKKDVLKWCKSHDASILRPMFEWSAQDVIDYIVNNNQEPNPLYKRGASRVGCYPCIMSTLSEIKVLAKDEQMLNRLITLEEEVGKIGDKKKQTFFSKGKIPARFCKEIGGGIPTVTDVVKYVTRDDANLDMFEPEEGYSCMSLYHGLCE